jgi:hypothetical protein
MMIRHPFDKRYTVSYCVTIATIATLSMPLEHASAQPHAPAGAVTAQSALATRLQALNSADWRTAYDVGNQIAALPPEEGFALVRENWSKLTNDDAKRQILKAFWYKMPYPLTQRNHPRVLDVLHLGATDAALPVQGTAFTYLKDLAFQDFNEDYAAYLEWHKRNSRTPLPEVRRQNGLRFVGELKTAQGADRERLARFLRHGGFGLSGDSPETNASRTQLIDAGALRVTEEWLSVPRPSDDLIQGASAMVQSLQPDEAWMKRVILPLLEPSKPETVRAGLIYSFGGRKAPWILDSLLSLLVRYAASPDESVRSHFSGISQILAGQEDPRVIPTMIGVILADDTKETILRCRLVRPEQTDGG